MRKQCTALGCFSLLLSATTPLTAAQIECQYDTNAEWPQPVDKVCQSQELTQTDALLSNDAAAVDWPYCSDARFDSDGDGWGWENNASCLAPQTPKSVVCESASSDSNGDGWGWEHGASCQVASTPRTPSNDFPECISISSDSDSDGWGWENGASCQVASTLMKNFLECEFISSDSDGDGWGWENGASCQVTSSASDENNRQLIKNNTLVFEQNFEAIPLGSYGSSQLNKDWKTPIWHLGFSQGRVDVVSDAPGKAIRVTYPANKFGAAGAAAFLSDLELGLDLPASYNELYLSYDVKFAKGFDFVRGGKLPGLCGYDNTLSSTSGCNTGGGFPDGYDGWSARGMWREDGKLENYVYHAGQKNYYGDDEYWDAHAQPGKWHRVQHRVVMNTPRVANGILEAWLDGNKVLSGNNFKFRNSPGIGINLFYFSTFYGGNDSSWAPTEDQHIYFDNFRIATTPEPTNGSGSLSLNDDSDTKEPSKTNGGGGVSFLPIFLLLLFGLKPNPVSRRATATTIVAAWVSLVNRINP